MSLNGTHNFSGVYHWTLRDLSGLSASQKIVQSQLADFRDVASTGFSANCEYDPFYIPPKWDAQKVAGHCKDLAIFSKSIGFHDETLALIRLMRNDPWYFLDDDDVYRDMENRPTKYCPGFIEMALNTIGQAIEEAAEALELSNLPVPGAVVVDSDSIDEINRKLVMAADVDLENLVDGIALDSVKTAGDSDEAAEKEDGPTGVGAWRHNGKELPLDNATALTEKPWRFAKALFTAMPGSLSVNGFAEAVNQDHGDIPAENSVKNWQNLAKKWFNANDVPLTISKAGTDFTMQRTT